MVGSRGVEQFIAVVLSAWLVTGAVLLTLYLTQPDKVEEVPVEFVFNDEVYVPPQLYTDNDLQVATMLIYFEARGEPVECQRLVLEVALNRVKAYNFPHVLEEVVWQRRQFSFTHDGKLETYDDLAAKAVAKEIAIDVLIGNGVDLSKGALYYYNPKKADPYWKDAFEVTYTCGDHLFLKEK